MENISDLSNESKLQVNFTDMNLMAFWLVTSKTYFRPVKYVPSFSPVVYWKETSLCVIKISFVTRNDWLASCYFSFKETSLCVTKISFVTRNDRPGFVRGVVLRRLVARHRQNNRQNIFPLCDLPILVKVLVVKYYLHILRRDSRQLV